MVGWHSSSFVSMYYAYIQDKYEHLKFNHKFFKYLSIIFLLISLVLALIDIYFLTQDVTDLRKTDLLVLAGLVVFFDLFKLFYILKNVFLFALLMALTSLILLVFIYIRVETLRKDGMVVRSLTMFSIIYLLLSLGFSIVYHLPTFHQLIFTNDAH